MASSVDPEICTTSMTGSAEPDSVVVSFVSIMDAKRSLSQMTSVSLVWNQLKDSRLLTLSGYTIQETPSFNV